MSTHKKKKSWLIAMLVLLLFALCIFVSLWLRQQKEIMESKAMAAKLEPWE